MINFINKRPKWPKMIKADSAYLKSFNQAILNFEQNILEEREVILVPKNKKLGFTPGSRI